MSVLQKLFHKRSSSQKSFNLFCRKPRPMQPTAVIEFPSKHEKCGEESIFLAPNPPPHLRLVLFQEEGMDRRLLFDSKSFDLHSEQETKSCGDSPHVNPYINARRCSTPTRLSQYVYVRGPQDSDILSEMLFGAPGMASRASSLKIHIMKDPKRLMLSRVFCVEKAKETGSLERGLDTQRPSNRRKAQTMPVPTPEPTNIQPTTPSLASSLTRSITRSDSSSSLMALTQMFGSFGTSGSLGSRSITIQSPTSRAHSLPHAVRQSSRDSFNLNQEPHSGLVSRRTKVKIGFAVIFQPEPSNTRDFQRFFFEHFPLIESYITSLKEDVESTLNNFKKGRKMEFIEAMMEALNDFSSRIHSIYSTPRLPRPVWPTLTSQSKCGLPWRGDGATIECFISELARMVSQHNSKQRNFFMTGLVTSVLTHHLGWVNTTVESNENENSRTISYNPLWAQLGDLYGAVGSPTKVAKTVVVGDMHETVSTIISILSYFIRCSDVKEVVRVPSDFSPRAFDGVNASLKMSLVDSVFDQSDSYVLVDVDEKRAKESINHDVKMNTEKEAPPKKGLNFCHQRKKSKPVEVQGGNNGSKQVVSSSVLCRSRSSPSTSVKPLFKFSRQKSSGNFETHSPRVRTNSNEAFAKPRSVQSRRTSRDTMSRSTLSIPDASISSAETYRFIVQNPAITSEDNQKLPENISSSIKPCSGGQMTRQKTHKRVSSEPFKINNTCSDFDDSATLCKTRSTCFQPIQQIFVENTEPKIVHMNHVRRAAQVLPTCSPIPNHSKAVFGFKTNELKSDLIKTRDFDPKNSSPSPKKLAEKDSDKKIPLTTPKTAPTSDTPKFDFTEPKGQRSSSSSAIRRNSSAKTRIAQRRKKLSESSRNMSIEEEEVESKPSNLPSLIRIPSIALEHDEFNEYFSGEEGEFIYFGQKKGDEKSSENNSAETKPQPISSPKTQSSLQNQSTPQKAELSENNSTNSKSENRSSITKRIPPPLPTSPPNYSNAKVQNHSSVMKKTPPPLPSLPPGGKRPPIYPKPMPTRSPPPLPTSNPVHTQVPLYPSLTETPTRIQPPKDLNIPKSLIYPNLNDSGPQIAQRPNLYPSLNSPATSNSLYPTLSNCTDGDPPPYQAQSSATKDSSQCISQKTEIPLQEVEFSENLEEKISGDEETTKKMTYRELIADYSPEYLWGFALHGTKNNPDLVRKISHELTHSISVPVLDEQVAEAVSILADTDKWTVNVFSSHRIHSDKFALPALNSKLVMEILERVKKLYQMRVPPEFCLQQLEQSLGELVLKSRMLAGYVNGNTRVTMSQLSAILGIESSDLPLLMSIASCHSPHVARVM